MILFLTHFLVQFSQSLQDTGIGYTFTGKEAKVRGGPLTSLRSSMTEAGLKPGLLTWLFSLKYFSEWLFKCATKDVPLKCATLKDAQQVQETEVWASTPGPAPPQALAWREELDRGTHPFCTTQGFCRRAQCQEESVLLEIVKFYMFRYPQEETKSL